MFMKSKLQYVLVLLLFVVPQWAKAIVTGDHECSGYSCVDGGPLIDADCSQLLHVFHDLNADCQNFGVYNGRLVVSSIFLCMAGVKSPSRPYREVRVDFGDATATANIRCGGSFQEATVTCSGTSQNPAIANANSNGVSCKPGGNNLSQSVTVCECYNGRISCSVGQKSAEEYWGTLR